MSNYKEIIYSTLKSVLMTTSNIKIKTSKNVKLLNNKKIDSLALVTFFSELEKKIKPKKDLLSKYENFKYTDDLIKYLKKNEKS